MSKFISNLPELAVVSFEAPWTPVKRPEEAVVEANPISTGAFRFKSGALLEGQMTPTRSVGPVSCSVQMQK
jgi:hypothetical protein